jgi:hypothetical protein
MPQPLPRRVPWRCNRITPAPLLAISAPVRCERRSVRIFSFGPNSPYAQVICGQRQTLRDHRRRFHHAR